MAVVGVILLATFLASITDWLFFDLLIHRYYRLAPALWRPGGTARIVSSSVIGTLASAAAVLAEVAQPGRPLWLALLLWAAGALPIGLQNPQWLRLHVMIAASHALGWLARLLIGTVLAALLLD